MSADVDDDDNNDPIGAMWRILPGSREIQWERTAIGRLHSWPVLLKSFTAFLTSLSHPAALYWGEGLVLIYNEPWRHVRGDAMQQGQSQIDQLDPKAVESVRYSMDQQVAANAEPCAFLEHAPQDHQLLLSPLVDADSGRACGVMAQLFPPPLGEAPRITEELSTGSSGVDALLQSDDMSSRPRSDRVNFAKFPLRNPEGDGSVDDLPLDAHPFFRRIAAMLPTGLAILNHKAEAVFVNKQFYELTTHMEGNKSFKSWPHTIHPEHFERVMKAYQRAVDTQMPLRIEFRSQGEGDPWRLLLLAPLGDGHMSHASLRKHGGFICAVIDITSNKMAELGQQKAAREAQERKDQQERFIDMISHEIRNPLSAVLHCAENILDTLKTDAARIPSESRDQIAEATDTIMLCVAHQKNIVDDILSFSKLDSSMLSLCPRSVQPKRQLAKSLKMFQPEFRKHSIKFEYKVDWTYHDFHVDWVKADLVRISQVLVNLITNAIKFTSRKDGKKKVTVAMGASVERPVSYPPNVVFFDSEDLGYRMDGTNTSEWGNGETLYIMVAVIDTGIGISDISQRKLFERFRQATPRTEEEYGGSGLGLNISRKLCQLHGGEIGVKSEEGKGSVFAFFFKVRRIEAPQGEVPPAGDRLDDTELGDRVEKFEAAPSLPVNENEIPECLVEPKYEYVPEANLRAAIDGKWEHTAKIASNVRESTPDRYGVMSRPWAKRIASSQSEGGPNLSSKTELSEQNAERPPATTKVLLVEDNLINQRLLRRKLEAKGYSVLTANNGREAVDAVQTAAEAAQSTDTPHVGFDIILMDQEMPTMDGNAASCAIRKWEHRLADEEGVEQHVPILGVTANVREEQKDAMRSAGMDDVISKPYKIEEIVEKIHGLLGPRGQSPGADDGAKQDGT